MPASIAPPTSSGSHQPNQVTENEELFRTMFERAPIGIALVSPDGRWLRVNESVCRIVGYPAEELLKMTFQDVTHPDDMDADLTLLKAALSGERESYQMEKRYVRKDGRPVWIQLSATLVRTPEGVPRYFISHIEDIDQRKEMEFALRESEDRFRLLIDNAPVMVWKGDEAAKYTFFNRAWLEFTGRTLEEERGRGWVASVYPDDAAQVLRRLEEGFAARERIELVYRLRRNDGVYRWIQDTSVPFFGSNGTFGGYLGVCADLTEMLEAQRQISGLAERLMLATEAAHVGVWEWTPGSEVLVWDSRMFEIYGLEARASSEITFEEWKNLVHPENVASLLDGLRWAVAGRDGVTIEFRILHPTQGVRHLRGSARVLRDARGQAVKVVGVNSDVTDERIVQDQLRLAKELAEEANRAKSAFLAMMSHEIRTPLHGIIGFTHLLGDSPLTAEQQDYLSSIENGGATLLTLINDILDYSKIEAGKIAIERIPYGVTGCIEGVVELLGVKAAEKGLHLTYTIDPSVPSAVFGDATRLGQVLMNLLSNAVKFTPQGAVSLAVKSGRMPNGASALDISVTDTGIGIAPDLMSQLFQPFSQLDASTTRRFGGTGLGLAISRRLVELMGGTITIVSEDGAGTIARVILPADPAVFAPGEDGLARVDRRSGGAAVRNLPDLEQPAAGLRVLVAEDNSTNQRLIRKLLERMGLVSVEVAGDGMQAVERTLAGNFDVVLMDCQMPRMDGYEATEKIRNLEEGRPLTERVVIIALTAAALDGDRQRALAAGMDDYLTKPLRPEALAKVLNDAAVKLARR